MHSEKYGVTHAIKICFRYASGASLIKLCAEIASGIFAPLMVLVVASFINNSVAFVDGSIELVSVIAPIALMATYYAYSQVSQIVVRMADKSMENALREKLRPQLVQKHASVSYSHLENPETLDLITRVCDNAEKNMMAMLNTCIRVIRIGIQTFGTLSLLVTYAWWLIPLFILSAIPIALIASKGGKAIYASDVITTKLTRRHYYLSSILVGRETAAKRTLFGYADDINAKFSTAHLKRSNMVTKEIAIEEVAINACGLILDLLVLAAIFVLLRPVGDHTMSLGLYVSLIGALIGLARTITGTVSRLISDAIGFIAYMRDYTRFFALPNVEANADQIGESKTPAFTGLEIRNLRFRYTPESPYVLNGVNLTIEQGKSYSLIGQNGAGKSTLTKILLGLYRDFEGEILINGADISEYSTDDLHHIFSIVYQDFAKYYISLGDNITLGNNQGDLDLSLHLAELDDVVAKLPQKENTPLGKIFDDGVDISGGEWQKVAIARALYANAPFMILDEPTASLSPMTESRLYNRFAEIIEDRTSLLISHRLGSTKLSDVLFVLSDGIIAETGTHDELMTTNGVYAEMFQSQRSWYDER